MVVSQMVMGICFLSCGFFIQWHYAPFLIVLGKFFDGITDPAREALEGDITRPDQRQAAFSLLYQVTNVAFTIGPLLAGFLFRSYPKWLFFVSGTAQLVTMLVVGFLVHESLPSPEMVLKAKEQKSAERAEEGSTWNALMARPLLLWFSLGVLFTALSYRQVYFALPIHLDTLFKSSGSSLYGFLLSLNSVIVIVLNPFALSFSKKHPLVWNLTLASILYAVGFSCLGFVSTPLQFSLVAVVYTLGELMMSNNDQAYRLNNTPMNYRGRFSALLKMFITVGQLAGPLLGGILIEKTSFACLWVVTGMCSLFGACCFVHLWKYKDAQGEIHSC